MGSLFAGSCYASDADAQIAELTLSAPVITGADAFSLFEYRVDHWELVGYTAGVETSSSVVPSQSFPACDVGASAVDGAVLAFAVMAAWAVAFWARSLKEASAI